MHKKKRKLAQKLLKSNQNSMKKNKNKEWNRKILKINSKCFRKKLINKNNLSLKVKQTNKNILKIYSLIGYLNTLKKDMNIVSAPEQIKSNVNYLELNKQRIDWAVAG